MPNKAEPKTVTGLITEASDTKTAKGDRPYRIINVGAEKFSCWLPELFGELEEGMSVQFRWSFSKDGKWKNIVDVESDGNGSRAGGNGGLTKDELIVRQSSLATASKVVNTLEDDYEKATQVILTMAEAFETWVWRKKTTEPEPPEED